MQTFNNVESMQIFNSVHSLCKFETLCDAYANV